MSEPLQKIRNHHAVTCVDPPIINGENPAVYIGYFENAYGEQWIFTYDREFGQGELRGGDVGWNTVQLVEHGQVERLILGADEAAWLQACWRAARPKSG